MIRNSKFSLSVIFLIAFAFSLNSQSSGKNNNVNISAYEITDTTHSCVITTIKGRFYEDVNIFGLGDSSIKILKKDSVKELMIKEIGSIKFNRRGFWTGAAIGAGVAYGIGLLGGKGFSTGDGQQKYSVGNVVLIGTILAVPLGLIGGGLGVLFAADHLYVLHNLNFDEKRKKVKFLIKEYSDR